MAYNKIIYNGTTLLDLTDDTVEQAYVLSGYQFHGNDGEVYTGTMTNRGAVTGTISTASGSYTIPAGYHSGSGSVSISSVETAKLIATNIKSGVTLLGVSGTYTGEDITLQTKSVSYTPSADSQTATISCDSGYDGLETVTVTIAAIPYTETANDYGTTVTIG